MPQTITRARWECRCSEPDAPLGTHTPDGRCEIKLGDRRYLISGVVHAICPRCGAQHILDVTRQAVS